MSFNPSPRTVLIRAALVTGVLGAAPCHAETLAFDIPAQPLNQALLAFGKQSGKRLMYSSDIAADLRSRAIKGQYAPEQALTRMLGGTPLEAVSTGSGSIVLQRKAAMQENNAPQSTAALPRVTVTGTAVYEPDDPYNPSYTRPNASTATKTDTPIMQTPLSVKVVPQQVLQDQQVVRLDQALRNVSGVVSGSGGDRQFFIRGFDTYNYYRDGYPFQNQWYHTEDLTNVERVEVLKGPGSVLYGRAEPGGIINFVTKQPLDIPYYSLRQQFGSFDWYRTNVDATGPLTSDASLAYRFNLGYQSNHTIQAFAGEERLFIAPALRWHIGEKTTSTFKLEYSDIKENGTGNLPLAGNRPANLPRRQNLGDPWNRTEDEYVMLSWNTRHAFNDDWSLSHRFNFSNAVETISNRGVRGGKNLSANGDVGRFFFAQNIDGNDYLHNFYNALELTGKFTTGFLKHTLLVGGDYLRGDVRATMAGFTPQTADTTNIYNPIHQPGPPTLQPGDVTQFNWTLPWFGLYAQDQIELPYHIHVLAGLRYDNAETSSSSSIAELGSRTPTQNDVNDRVSPRGGLLFQPIPELSLYGSYTENFGASNTFTLGSPIPLPPQTAQQWEVGAKSELWDGRFSATLAYFDLTKQNLAMQVAQGITRAVGEAESRGIEFDLSGEILPGWNIIGAYAFTPFAETMKDTPAAGTVGRRLHNAPVNSGSLWTTYWFQEGLMRGLKLGAGMQAVGQREIGYTETAQAPGYITAGLMASYQWRVGASNVTAQLNLDNLFDKTYIGHVYSYGPSHYGAPRTFLGSVKVEF